MGSANPSCEHLYLCCSQQERDWGHGKMGWSQRWNMLRSSTTPDTNDIWCQLSLSQQHLPAPTDTETMATPADHNELDHVFVHIYRYAVHTLFYCSQFICWSCLYEREWETEWERESERETERGRASTAVGFFFLVWERDRVCVCVGVQPGVLSMWLFKNLLEVKMWSMHACPFWKLAWSWHSEVSMAAVIHRWMVLLKNLPGREKQISHSEVEPGWAAQTAATPHQVPSWSAEKCMRKNKSKRIRFLLTLWLSGTVRAIVSGIRW